MAEGWYHLPYKSRIEGVNMDGSYKIVRVFGGVVVDINDIDEFLELTGIRSDKNSQHTKMRFFNSVDFALFKMKFGIQ